MAENTVSQRTSNVNENSTIQVEYMDGSIPAVLSTDVALRFQRKHQHILRDIDRIRSQVPKIFFETNFGQSFRETATGFGTVRKFPAYLLTRDAFSLLVMGFTGAAAIRWKLKYIEAFNALESETLHNHASLAHDLGYQQGLAEARALPAMEAERKVAYLDGMKEGAKLQKRKDGLGSLERTLTYLAKGVSLPDAAKLVSVPESTLRQRVERLRRGFLGVNP